jgi:hypothetical protein
LQGFSFFREYWKILRRAVCFSISHRLTCPIRNLILRARDAIKATGSLSLLRGFPESRTTTLTANRVRILRKIRYVLVTAKTFN